MALRLLSSSQTFQRVGYSYHLWSAHRTNVGRGKIKAVTIQWTRTTVTDVKSGAGWRGWRAAARGFLPIGICLAAVMGWRAVRRRQPEAAHWEIQLYCLLPLRAISRAWGWLAERQLPETLRPPLLGLYARIYGVNLNEAASSHLQDYCSLAEFFARPLRPDVRPVDYNSCLVAPCDGRVLHFGTVDSNTVEQVKGVTYSLEQFLRGRDDANPAARDEYRKALLKNPQNTLYQCILYLAPGDYHRFHSPSEWFPERRLHLTGQLLSVNPRIASWIPGLFALNERAVYLGRWLHGFFSFTAVGATNVGSLRVYFDRALHTNCKGQKGPCVDTAIMPNDLSLRNGDPVGEFRMGSTVVLIFEAPRDFRFQLKTGQVVRMGQSIGCVSTAVPLTHQDKLQPRTALSSAA